MRLRLVDPSTQPRHRPHPRAAGRLVVVQLIQVYRQRMCEHCALYNLQLDVCKTKLVGSRNDVHIRTSSYLDGHVYRLRTEFCVVGFIRWAVRVASSEGWTITFYGSWRISTFVPLVADNFLVRFFYLLFVRKRLITRRSGFFNVIQ
jgi:hypothetical protein